METLPAYKVVRRMKHNRLVSLIPFDGWWCGYIPGIPTTPKVDGSLLFAFSTLDAAMKLARSLPWTEVWSALVDGEEWNEPTPGEFGASERYWEWVRSGKVGHPLCPTEPSPSNVLACVSVTLVEQRWVNPIA